MSFLEELNRRNVIKVAVFYTVASWLILQVAELLFDVLGLPESWLRLVLALLVLGLPLVLVFAWVFELTPDGVKREKDVDRSQSITRQTGRRMDVAIVVLLVLAIATVGVDRLLGPPAQSIAVLPFADLSPVGDQEYFADGIAEEILNVLVRIEGLKVASRTTSWGFKGQEALGIPYMAEKMNVRHVLEGSVRKSGDMVRITAQLIDADTDQHLWSETYDRTLTAASIFAVQDDIATSIVEKLGIIMDADAVAPSHAADTRNINAYELYLEAWQLFTELHRAPQPAARHRSVRAGRRDRPRFRARLGGALRRL
jgi:TolB-like protein